MSNVKICIVVTKANLGGAQRYVESLAMLLASRSFSPLVVAGEGDQLMPRLARAKIDTWQVSGLGNSSIVADARLVTWLYRQYQHRKIDRIVFNSTKLLAVAWLLSFLLPSRIIYFVCHGFPFIPGCRSYSNRIKQKLFFGLMRRIRTVICVSDYVRSLVDANVPAGNNILLARNTIEPSVAVELAAPDSVMFSDYQGYNLELPDGELSVVQRKTGVPLRAVSLAELNYNKGIDALCEALALHRDDLIGRFEWHVYGDGTDRELVQGIIRAKRLDGIVMLHGFRENARDLIKNFDVLLIPSRNEAFGMVALEAAASGVYVFGLAVGGVPEAIISDKFGRTFETVESMAQTLQKLSLEALRPRPPRELESQYWIHRYNDWSQIHLDAITT